MLVSRQIPNGSQDFFFLFNTLIFIYFFKYETVETYARAFFMVNILSIGGVLSEPTIVQDCFHEILLKKVACRDID